MTASDPTETETFERTLVAIRDDRAKGAAALARDGLEALALSALDAEAADTPTLFRLLRHRARQLTHARPSMAPLSNLTGRFIAKIQPLRTGELGRFRHTAADAALHLIRLSQEAGILAARKAAQRIGDHRHVASLSDSGTVFQTFMALDRAGTVKALIGEGRPGCEGITLATRLAEAGIPVELMTDAALIGAVASQTATSVDAVVIGADTLLPDGGAINKTGSLGLALAAKAAGIPLFVVAESFKRLPEGTKQPAIEDMGEADLGYTALGRMIAPGIALKNPYFEEIPAALIGRIVTEEG